MYTLKKKILLYLQTEASPTNYHIIVIDIVILFPCSNIIFTCHH